MGVLLAVVILLWAGVACALGPGETLLDAGRQAYAAGRYAEAAQAFAAVARQDPGAADAALCLDAATASRLAGDPGRATAWLYRARAVAPSDRAVAAALAAAGLDPSAADPPCIGRPLSPRGLWLLVLGANALFWLGLAGARLFPLCPPRPLLLAAAVALGGLWLGTGWSVLAPVVSPRGVVLYDTAAASAPEPGAEALFSLAPGTVVVLGPSRRGRTRATVAGNRAGWVDRDAIALLPR